MKCSFPHETSTKLASACSIFVGGTNRLPSSSRARMLCSLLAILTNLAGRSSSESPTLSVSTFSQTDGTAGPLPTSFFSFPAPSMPTTRLSVPITWTEMMNNIRMKEGCSHFDYLSYATVFTQPALDSALTVQKTFQDYTIS